MSFRAKVLAPMVAVMVLLTAILMWLDNRRSLQQLQADTSQQLATSEAVFKNWQKSRAEDLLSRYQIVANDPKFKSVTGKTDFQTFRNFLDGLLDRRFVDVDVIMVGTDEGQLFPPVTHDPHVDVNS